MPTYEYACDSCGRHIEVVHGFNDDPPRSCEKCGGDLHKVFHPVGIVFKGSGFYKTDSRPAAGEKSEKSSDKSRDKSSDKSKDSGKKSTSSESSGSSD